MLEASSTSLIPGILACDVMASCAVLARASCSCRSVRWRSFVSESEWTRWARTIALQELTLKTLMRFADLTALMGQGPTNTLSYNDQTSVPVCAGCRWQALSSLRCLCSWPCEDGIFGIVGLSYQACYRLAVASWFFAVEASYSCSIEQYRISSVESRLPARKRNLQSSISCVS